MTARWKKELRKAADREAEEYMANMEPATPKPPLKLEPFKPASMQPGSDKLAFFWIGYFVFFLIVAPILIELL